MGEARRQLKIMLVEDSEELVDSFVEIFSLDGHEVKSYLSGKAAIEDRQAIEESDVLVSDYYLTDLNGMEVIAKARQIRPSLPVILLSGAREPAVLDSLRSLPMARFLSKPVDIDDLEKGIHELVNASRAA